ncbi:DUF5065 family protein [Bacillus clarus]|uniref:DUF5065 family protein n=1 Tax=Bacillus clarus TaxID=2338372 RepID=A0ABX9L205_9BACI|nr:DUF5065 family protein [Bacillus clarus]
MNPTFSQDPVSGQRYQEWQTTFNSAYPPGWYVIIGYIDGKHMKIQIMPINQYISIRNTCFPLDINIQLHFYENHRSVE